MFAQISLKTDRLPYGIRKSIYAMRKDYELQVAGFRLQGNRGEANLVTCNL